MTARATPFHIRAAEKNRGNAWIIRNGFTLAREYAGAHEEALTARFSVVMADITWRWRVFVEGTRAAEFLSRLTTRDTGALAPGAAHKALWLSDGGALRGAGVIARHGRDSFLLAASSPDAGWITDAAAMFEVGIRDVSQTQGGIAVVGPWAAATVAAAGLDASLEPLAFRKVFWRGLDVTVSRWGEHGGFEIWCEADDGVIVWDRIARAGDEFGIVPVGTTATDILDMEAGVARPYRDYQPADKGRATEPSPKVLRLEKLVDELHPYFNGRAAYLAASPRERIVGIELDSESPAPDMILYKDGVACGRMLTSLHSPALRRAIGWARIDAASAVAGTRLSLQFGPEASPVAARVVELPFLPTVAPA